VYADSKLVVEIYTTENVFVSVHRRWWPSWRGLQTSQGIK